MRYPPPRSRLGSPDVAKHAEEPRAGDALVRLGAGLFALGTVAIAVMFVPFVKDLVTHGARYAQDRHEYGLALNLASFLTAIGMAVALAGLVRQARESRARARSAGRPPARPAP